MAPFLPDRTIVSTALIVVVTNGVASAEGRILIYGPNGDNQPGPLIDASPDLDLSSNGDKSWSKAQTFTAGELYFLGVQFSNHTPTMRAINSTNLHPVDWSTGVTPDVVYRQFGFDFGDPPPDPYGSTVKLSVNMPMVLIAT